MAEAPGFASPSGAGSDSRKKRPGCEPGAKNLPASAVQEVVAHGPPWPVSKRRPSTVTSHRSPNSILARAAVAALLGLLLPASARARSASLPGFTEVARRVRPSVVNLAITQNAPPPSSRRGPGGGPGGMDPFDDFFRRFFGERPGGGGPMPAQRSLGSGFIIDEDGYIATNAHVVNHASKVVVRLSDKAEYPAKIIGVDEKTDVALIKIENSKEHLVPVTFGDFSAKERVLGAGPYDDFIQTDAAINPGNSGGPLVDADGRVIGINAAISSRSGGNDGIGFAIPINLARGVLDQLRKSGKVERGWLGVSVQSVTPELAESFGLPESAGALVAAVSAGSPAEKAAIERGDVILAFNGTPIQESHQLPALVAQAPIGQQATVTVLRQGKRLEVPVNVVRQPDDIDEEESQPNGGGENGAGPTAGSAHALDPWGLRAMEITPEIARRNGLPVKRGVVINDVADGSAAAEAGIQPGDVLREVNRTPVTTLSDVRAALKKASRKDLLVLVQRGDATAFHVLKRN